MIHGAVQGRRRPAWIGCAAAPAQGQVGLGAAGKRPLVLRGQEVGQWAGCRSGSELRCSAGRPSGFGRNSVPCLLDQVNGWANIPECLVQFEVYPSRRLSHSTGPTRWEVGSSLHCSVLWPHSLILLGDLEAEAIECSGAGCVHLCVCARACSTARENQIPLVCRWSSCPGALTLSEQENGSWH